MKTDKESLSGYFHCDKTVREDNSITDITKLVFGDIAYFYFLGEGSCHAGNGFFAIKYGKSKGTISKAVSALEDKGYILRYLDEHRNRTIYVNRSAFSKDNDSEDLLTSSDNPPDNDPQLPVGDAPITSENQKELEKKFPNISKLDSDEAAS